VKPKRPPTRVGALPTRRRLNIYGIAIGVWVTGAVWLVYHYFVRTIDNFGFENVHPHQQWWLIAHAVFSFAAVWMFGVLWPNHIKKGWKLNTQRLTGGSLFGVITWLTLTGLALYYIGDDALRSWTSILHWGVGLAGLAVFLIHLRTGPSRETGPEPHQDSNA
jgi:hypothetical protein